MDPRLDCSIEQRADQGVDGWLASLARAGWSPTWREEQARRLGRAVRAWPARSDAASAAALQRFLMWERQRCAESLQRIAAREPEEGTARER